LLQLIVCCYSPISMQEHGPQDLRLIHPARALREEFLRSRLTCGQTAGTLIASLMT
jgi:hypothetical protein